MSQSAQPSDPSNTDPTPGGGGDPQGAPAAGAAATPTPPSGGEPNPEIDKLSKALKASNAEAAAYRVKMKELMKVFGLDEKGNPDPEAVRSELDRIKSENLNLHTQMIAAQAATEAGVDAELALSYLQGKGKLSDFDPKADGAKAKLAELFKAAAKDKPGLASGPAPAQPKVGVPPSQAGGGDKPTVNGWLKNALNRGRVTI
jgi:hypothetical protein